MRDYWVLIIFMIAICVLSFIGAILILTHPCLEEEIMCEYGGRGGHTKIDCNTTIKDIPNGESIHKYKRCVRR